MTSLRNDFAAVILAAGKGTRMRSATHKVLHPVGGRPLLLHLLATLEAEKPQHVVVIAGDRSEQIGAAVAGTADIVIQHEQLGTGHAVLQAEGHLGDIDADILILFGDVPLVRGETMRRLLDAIRAPDGSAMAVLAFRPPVPGSYGRVITNADGTIRKMVEAKDATPEELAVTLCNSGMMAVRRGNLFPLLHEVGCDNAAGEYYLPDIVGIAQEKGLKAIAIEANAGELLGVNDRHDLAAVEAAFQNRRRAEIMSAGVTLVAPETCFFSADTAIGRDTVVEPYVVFGPGVTIGEQVVIRSHSHVEGARIADRAEIGPFARLRPGSVLKEGSKVGNFVEMKKTTLGRGAKANHLTYLGDATVGERANIGAGTITCNYDGYGKYRTVIGDGAFVGSNTSLIAPVRIGNRAIIGAGSAVSRDVADDALGVVRAPQIEKAGWASAFRARKTPKGDQ